MEKNEIIRLQTDNKQDNLVLPFENGRNKKQTYDQINQRCLVLSSK